MAFGRDVDNQEHHRKVGTQNYPAEGAVRRDKGQKRPPCGECPPTLAPGTRSGLPPPVRQPRPFVPVVPEFPRLTPPGQLVSGLLRICDPGRGSSAFSALRRGTPHLYPTQGLIVVPFSPFPFRPFEARSTSLLGVGDFAVGRRSRLPFGPATARIQILHKIVFIGSWA